MPENGCQLKGSGMKMYRSALKMDSDNFMLWSKMATQNFEGDRMSTTISLDGL